MIFRRGLLKAGGVIFGGLVVLGGIASETDYIDDPDQDKTNQGTSGNSESDGEADTPQGDDSGNDQSANDESSAVRETLRDERLRTQTRWPHEFEAGDNLYVTLEVDESGPAGFTIFHDEERDVSESWIVKLEDTIEYEIELDGLHQLVVDPNGVVDVVIEVERGS